MTDFGGKKIHLRACLGILLQRHSRFFHTGSHILWNFGPTPEIADKADIIRHIHFILSGYKIGNAHTACQCANRHKKHQANHADRKEGCVDSGIDLPENKHIEIFKVMLFSSLHKPQEETRKREKEKKCANNAKNNGQKQGFMEHTVFQDDGICCPQAANAHKKHHHRDPQSLHPEILVLSVCIDQINQTKARHGNRVKGHNHQENHAKIQNRLQACLFRENKIESGKIRLKHAGREHR